jgi:mycothiol synthase
MVAAPQFPDGYRIRVPSPDEAAEIERLSAAADAALGTPPTLSEELLLRMWERPRFVLADDAWIVERGQDVVAFGQVWAEDPRRLSGFAVVHPEHTGRGIGSTLAGQVEGRGSELAVGEARLFSATIPQDEAAAALLAGRGYAWARRFWQMEADLDEAPGDAVPPPGIALRPLDADRDLEDAHRVLEAAFEDHWDYVSISYEEFLDTNIHRDHFDPGLWIVAEDAGRPVGVLTGSAGPDLGSVLELGVLRSHRGRGIASAMLAAVFAEFRRRGLPTARLNVDSDNPTGAVSVYERAGMRPASSYDLWSRTISGTREP